MSDVEFRGSLVSVFGPPGSGKTNFVKWVFKQPQYRRHLIFDPLREYDSSKYNVYRPSGRRYDDGGNAELNEVASRMVVDRTDPSTRPAYFVVDEANRTLPLNKDPGGPMQDLIDFNRHYEPGISVWFVSRRPAQLNTDAENLSTHTFVFGRRGKNDRSAYDKIHEDLNDCIDEKEQYGAAYVGEDGECRVWNPVDYLGETPTI